MNLKTNCAVVKKPEPHPHPPHYMYIYIYIYIYIYMSFHLVKISKKCKLTSSDSKHTSSWLEQGVGRREGWLDGIRKFLWWWFVIFDWGGGFKGTYVKTKRYICYKVGLKLNIQKTKIMVSGPITSWQIGGGNNGSSERLYFLGLQSPCRWWLHPWN